MWIWSFASHNARRSGRAQIRLTRAITRCNLGWERRPLGVRRERSDQEEIPLNSASAAQAATDAKAVVNVFMAVLLRVKGGARCIAGERSLACPHHPRQPGLARTSTLLVF